MSHSCSCEAVAATCGGDAEVELRRHDGLQVLLEGVACNKHQICQKHMNLLCSMAFSHLDSLGILQCLEYETTATPRMLESKTGAYSGPTKGIMALSDGLNLARVRSLKLAQLAQLGSC